MRIKLPSAFLADTKCLRECEQRSCFSGLRTALILPCLLLQGLSHPAFTQLESECRSVSRVQGNVAVSFMSLRFSMMTGIAHVEC